MSVVVLGAGISGLSFAHYLKKFGRYNVTIVDGSNRVGGWIKSYWPRDGVLFEQGPRTIRPADEAGLNTLSLIDDLNLTNEIKPITLKSAKALERYVYVGGTLHKLPLELGAVFKILPPLSEPLINSILRDLKQSRMVAEDDTMYNFAERRFGKHVADYIVSAVVCGVCGGNAKEISVHLLFSSLFEKEQKYGSVVKGFLIEFFKKKRELSAQEKEKKVMVEKEGWVMYSMKDGLECIPKSLYTSLCRSDVNVLLNSSCEGINLKEQFIVTSDEQKINFDFLVSSLPTYRLAPLLNEEHRYISDELMHIPYVSMAIVNLAYSSKALNLNGFGFLVPPIEKIPILGVVYDSCYQENDNWTILTVMMGGYAFNDHFNLSITDEELYNVAVKYVGQMLKITEPPDIYNVSLLKDCIPQYIVGHRKRVADISHYIHDKNLPIMLLGSAYHGIGINDIVLSSKKSASVLHFTSKLLK